MMEVSLPANGQIVTLHKSEKYDEIVSIRIDGHNAGTMHLDDNGASWLFSTGPDYSGTTMFVDDITEDDERKKLKVRSFTKFLHVNLKKGKLPLDEEAV